MKIYNRNKPKLCVHKYLLAIHNIYKVSNTPKILIVTTFFFIKVTSSYYDHHARRLNCHNWSSVIGLLSKSKTICFLLFFGNLQKETKARERHVYCTLGLSKEKKEF